MRRRRDKKRGALTVCKVLSNRILKTCNVEVCCTELPMLLARSTLNFKKKKKKKKCVQGDNKN